jgi:hypothetical protein
MGAKLCFVKKMALVSFRYEKMPIFVCQDAEHTDYSTYRIP